MQTNRILICLMLGTILLYGAPGTGNFILCLGEDGHVAIEEKTDDACCGDSSHEHDHGCGDCMDLPISLDDTIAPSVVVSSNGLDLIHLTECHRVSFFSIHPYRLLIPEAIPPPSSLSMLSTVILLI